MCLNDIKLDTGSSVATFWVRDTHLVNRMFSFYMYHVFLVVSHFRFAGGIVALIAPFPGHCKHFTLSKIEYFVGASKMIYSILLVTIVGCVHNPHLPSALKRWGGG